MLLFTLKFSSVYRENVTLCSEKRRAHSRSKCIVIPSDKQLIRAVARGVKGNHAPGATFEGSQK